MTDPNNPLNLLMTIETQLHRSLKGRWPSATREAIKGLRRALAARFETPAGPVHGSIDACSHVSIAELIRVAGKSEPFGDVCHECGEIVCKPGCPARL